MKIKQKARHKIQPFNFTVLKFQRSMIVPSIFLRFSIDFETVLSHIPTETQAKADKHLISRGIVQGRHRKKDLSRQITLICQMFHS